MYGLVVVVLLPHSGCRKLSSFSMAKRVPGHGWMSMNHRQAPLAAFGCPAVLFLGYLQLLHPLPAASPFVAACFVAGAEVNEAAIIVLICVGFYQALCNIVRVYQFETDTLSQKVCMLCDCGSCQHQSLPPVPHSKPPPQPVAVWTNYPHPSLACSLPDAIS
jgi:hypothetical protein